MLPPTITQNELRIYTAKDWDEQKPEIERLYKDNTLESVRAFMEQHHGLEAT
jgi:DNA-binding transcriptional MerR regulator